MDRRHPYILAVDDLHDDADSMAELLALWGYDPAARYDGASAMVAARARQPAAVLLDVGMPRMDGFEFAALLRELPGCERTPVVVISGHAAEACRVRGRELGIDHYLLKPADSAALRSLLGRLLDRPAPHRDRCGPRRRAALLP